MTHNLAQMPQTLRGGRKAHFRFGQEHLSFAKMASMAPRYILSEYVEQALAGAAYEKLEDGSYAGRVPICKGVVAFAGSLRECEQELRSTLEDWILVGLKLKHPLPIIGGIDLNKEPTREPVDAV
jgi:predicted RNase H-like HicB family nuclease